MQVLTGHISFETAFLIEDYPYGFRLRCQKKVWIEKGTKGQGKGRYRLVECTTNPKASYETWNKPKSSAYVDFMVMFLNDEGHVETMSCNGDYRLDEFKAAAYNHLTPVQQKEFDLHCKKMEIISNYWKERLASAS